MPGSIEGVYCYVGPFENVTTPTSDDAVSRSAIERDPNVLETRRESGFTVLPLRAVLHKSLVSLTRQGDRLDIRYSSKVNGSPRTLSWQVRSERGNVGGSVVEVNLPRSGGGATFGVGWSSRWAQISRAAGGRIAIIEHYRERGLALLLIPFQDHLVWRMDLDPVERCLKQT